MTPEAITGPDTARGDAHNSSVDPGSAEAGLCGQIHLPSGRSCFLPFRHHDSCQFDDPTAATPPARARTVEPG